MGKIDINPSTIITLGIIAGIGYIGYKFMKGEWKIPSVGDIITAPFKAIGEAVGSIPVQTPLPGGETLDAGTIGQLWEAGTGQAGTVYGVKNGEPAIGFIPPEAPPFPGIGQGLPGQIIDVSIPTPEAHTQPYELPTVEQFLEIPTPETKDVVNMEHYVKLAKSVAKNAAAEFKRSDKVIAHEEKPKLLTPLQLAAERRKQILGQV